MTIIIREPSKNDARSLAEVHVRSWQAAYKGQVPDDILDNLSVDQREKHWHLTLNSPSNKVLVAESEQRIVAFSSFGPVRDEGLDKNAVGEVYAIYALEEFWDRGIGRRLDQGFPCDPSRDELLDSKSLGSRYQPESHFFLSKIRIHCGGRAKSGSPWRG